MSQVSENVGYFAVFHVSNLAENVETPIPRINAGAPTTKTLSCRRILKLLASVGQHCSVTHLVLLHLDQGVVGFGHGKTFGDGLDLVALSDAQHFMDHAGTSVRTAGNGLLPPD